MARRYGTGSLYQRNGNWVGHWRSNGRQVKRVLGQVREPGSKAGLTKTQAEAELRRRIQDTSTAAGERLAVEEVSRRYRLAMRRKGRKSSSIQDVESHTRVHLEPWFGTRAMDGIEPEDVQDLVVELEAREISPKTIRNIVGTLSALFNFAMLPRHAWAARNPCTGVEIMAPEREVDVRFLTLAELDALIEHARPRDPRQGVDFQALDRVLYLVAAMTGLRRGELLALRWMDVDWLAARVRVRQNFVRGEFGAPKSRRSVRSVPLADEAARALEAWSKVSRFTDDDDLVFAHPVSGGPLSAGNVTRRMKAALEAAGMDDRNYVFHDLRHTFGTRMASAGAPLVSIKAWMGHRSIQTTLIYSDYMPSVRDAEYVSAAFDRSGSDSGSKLRSRATA